MRPFIHIFAVIWLMATGAHCQVVNVPVPEKEELALHSVSKYCRYNNGSTLPAASRSAAGVSMTGISGAWQGGLTLPAPASEPLGNLFSLFDKVSPLPDYQRSWFYPSGELTPAQKQNAEMWRHNTASSAVAEYYKDTSGFERSKIQHTRAWLTAAKPVKYERNYFLRVSKKVTVDSNPPTTVESVVSTKIPADGTESSPRDFKPGFLWKQDDDKTVSVPFNGSYKEEITVSRLPFEVVSRDKYLGGSITIPDDWSSLEFEIVGPDGTLGRYGSLLGGGTTRVTPSLEEILSDAEYAAGIQAPNQPVWFVKNKSDPRKVDFYACLESLGDVQLKFYLNGSSEPFWEVGHLLTEEQAMARWIDYADKWIEGSLFPWYEDPGPPVLGRSSMAAQGAAVDALKSGLKTAGLVIQFIGGETLEGMDALMHGVMEGFAAGVEDDWKLGEAIVGLTAKSADWLRSKAKDEVSKFMADPQLRTKCFLEASRTFFEEWVLHPVEQAAEQLGYTTTEMFSSWENFKNVSFRLMARAAVTGIRLNMASSNIAGEIDKGIRGWFDNFSNRMMTGAERSSFSQNPWPANSIVSGAAEAVTAMCYTTGYIAGYATEQVLVGMVAGSVAKVVLRNGLVFSGRLLARVEFAVGTRMHAVKKAVQGAAAAMELEVVVRRGLSKTWRPMPTKPIIISESVERMLKSPNFPRETYNYKQFVDDLINCPNIQKLMAIEGLESLFMARVVELLEMLGARATREGMAGFQLFYERSLWFDQSGNLLRDHFDDFIRVFDPASSPQAAEKLNTALKKYAAYEEGVDVELLSLRYLTIQDAAKAIPDDASNVLRFEHDEVRELTKRAEKLSVEFDGEVRRQEGLASARYEIQSGKDFRRVESGDLPEVNLRDVDLVEQGVENPTKFIDVKGPVVRREGYFSPTGTRTATGVHPDNVKGVGVSAVKKLIKNAKLNIDTTVVVDLFGLTAAEKQLVRATVVSQSQTPEAVEWGVDLGKVIYLEF